MLRGKSVRRLILPALGTKKSHSLSTRPAPMRLSKELSRVHLFIRPAVGCAGGGNRKRSSANGTLLGSSLVYDSRWALAAARRRSLRTGSTSRRNQRALVLLDHIRLQRTRHPRGRGLELCPVWRQAILVPRSRRERRRRPAGQESNGTRRRVEYPVQVFRQSRSNSSPHASDGRVCQESGTQGEA